MAKPRDFQRQKVYDWEHARYGDWPSVPLADLQELANDIVADFDLPRISLTSGRGRRRAALRYHRQGEAPAYLEYRPTIPYSNGRGEWVVDIALPKWARRRDVLMHELAHYIVAQVYGRGGVAVHGPEMVRIMLDLIAHYASEDFHGELASALLDGKLKVADQVPVAPDGNPLKVNRRAGVVAGAPEPAAAPAVAAREVRWEYGRDVHRIFIDGVELGQVEREILAEDEPRFYGRVRVDGKWYLAAVFSDYTSAANSVRRRLGLEVA